MKKKILSVFLATALFSTLMSGCSMGGSVSQTQGSNTPATEEETSNTLRVWGAEEDSELLQSLFASFKTENPDCKLEIVLEPMSEGDCKGQLLVNIAGAPDVFSFADDQLQALVASGVIDPVTNESVKSANVEGSVQAATLNGTLYAYPMTADNGYFMYYDKSVFTDADLQTLDGMMQKAASVGKKVFIDMGAAWYLYSFFGNTGLDLGLNDDGISNFCTWNSAENSIKGVDVLQAMIDIAKNPGFTPSDGVVAGAKDGTVCAGVSGVWDAAALAQIWGDNLGAVKLPTYTVAGQQVQMASFTGYKMIGVNTYSKNKEWAHKLADYLTNEKSQIARFNMRALGPSNINASASEEVSKSPALQAVVAQSAYGKLQRVGGNYWTPADDLGALAVSGNPKGVDLQQFLDSTVEAITKQH